MSREFDRSACAQCFFANDCRFMGLSYAEIEEVRRADMEDIFECDYIGETFRSTPESDLATYRINDKTMNKPSALLGHLNFDVDEFLLNSALPEKYHRLFRTVIAIESRFDLWEAGQKVNELKLISGLYKADDSTQKLFNILKNRVTDLTGMGRDS